MKNSWIIKIIRFVLICFAALIGVQLSFWLMNLASTLAFIGGVILFIISIGWPIEQYLKNRAARKIQSEAKKRHPLNKYR